MKKKKKLEEKSQKVNEKKKKKKKLMQTINWFSCVVFGVVFFSPSDVNRNKLKYQTFLLSVLMPWSLTYIQHMWKWKQTSATKIAPQSMNIWSSLAFFFVNQTDVIDFVFFFFDNFSYNIFLICFWATVNFSDIFVFFFCLISSSNI